MFKYFQCFGMLQAYILTECEMQENRILFYDHSVNVTLICIFSRLLFSTPTNIYNKFNQLRKV